MPLNGTDLWSEVFILPSPTPRIRSQVLWEPLIWAIAEGKLLSNWRMSLSKKVKGTPNLDSFPKVSSGNETPISLIAVLYSDIPVILPTQPVHPTFAKLKPSGPPLESKEW